MMTSCLQSLQRCLVALKTSTKEIFEPAVRMLKIDQERRALLGIVGGGTAAIRGTNLPPASRRTVAADQSVGRLRHDERRPGMIGELRQRALMCRSCVGAGRLERWQHDRAAGALQRLGKVLVRRRIRRVLKSTSSAMSCTSAF